MTKPFKTYRQQLNILRARGLDVGNTSKTMRYLEEGNYYDVINGYKDPFLQRNVSGKIIKPEKFKSKATLDELYSLYKFDRELRMIFLKYFLTFESNLKSRVSYRFSEKFNRRNAYLDFNNFSSRPEKLKDVLKTISTLSSTISRNATRKNTSIAHYVDVHAEVPLWVLVDYLSIGNISYFYSSSIDSIQNQIAVDFNKQYNRDYNLKGTDALALRPEHLKGIIQAINSFRNTCAHEEILYTYKIERPRTIKAIKQFISGFSGLDSPIQNNLFTVYLMLTLVLRKNDKHKIKSDLCSLFKNTSKKFNSVNFTDIRYLMGFPENWEEF